MLSAPANSQVAQFPAFAVQEWMGRIPPGKPVTETMAFYTYSRARLEWCRDHAIDSYRFIHG
jgi:hypothetical protein